MSTLEVARRVLLPELTPSDELALLARALWREGYDDHDGGHITYRQPDGTLLTLPREIGWNEMQSSDIVRIDSEGHQLEGRWTAPKAIVLHLEFHRARPGCDVTIHQHPRFATLWSATGRIPPAYDQRAAAVPDADIVLYNDYQAPVENLDGARSAVAAIGSASCAVLRSHGVFVIGDSIEQAFFRAVGLEWRCRLAWMAEAIGADQAMPEAGARALQALMQKTGSGASAAPSWLWAWAVRRELGPPPDVLG